MEIETDYFEYDPDFSLPLHEMIVALKKIAKQVSTQDLLEMQNIDKIIKMKRMIEVMEIPILMTES